MSRQSRIAAGTVAFVAATGLAVAAAPPAQLNELDTIIVSGAHPAPALWKVSKSKHVLWVLANYGPLPSDATWWQQLESRIAESQEVLFPASGDAYIDVGFLGMVKLGREAYRNQIAGNPYQKQDVKSLPDQKTLQDVLPADTWGMWLDLRRKYMGESDEADRYRPSAAVQALEDAAFAAVHRAAFPRSGLRRFGLSDAWALVKKHEVRIHDFPNAERKVKVGNPRDLLTSAGNQPLPDVECFTSGIARLESRVNWRKAEFDAWGRGDLQKLRSLHGASSWSPYGSCFDMEDALSFALDVGAVMHEFADTMKVRKLADDVRRNQEQADLQSQKDRIAAARAAIRKNKSTFTMASLHEIFAPDGFIEKMRALGYTIEGPT